MAVQEPIKTLSADERRARTVAPRVQGKQARAEAVNRATRRVKAKVAIDFVRLVRGG